MKSKVFEIRGVPVSDKNKKKSCAKFREIINSYFYIRLLIYKKNIFFIYIY